MRFTDFVIFKNMYHQKDTPELQELSKNKNKKKRCCLTSVDGNKFLDFSHEGKTLRIAVTTD